MQKRWRLASNRQQRKEPELPEDGTSYKRLRLLFGLMFAKLFSFPVSDHLTPDMISHDGRKLDNATPYNLITTSLRVDSSCVGLAGGKGGGGRGNVR